MEEHLGFRDVFAYYFVCLVVGFKYAVKEATNVGPVIKIYFKYH